MLSGDVFDDLADFVFVSSDTVTWPLPAQLGQNFGAKMVHRASIVWTCSCFSSNLDFRLMVKQEKSLHCGILSRLFFVTSHPITTYNFFSVVNFLTRCLFLQVKMCWKQMRERCSVCCIMHVRCLKCFFTLVIKGRLLFWIFMSYNLVCSSSFSDLSVSIIGYHHFCNDQTIAIGVSLHSCFYNWHLALY